MSTTRGDSGSGSGRAVGPSSGSGFSSDDNPPPSAPPSSMRFSLPPVPPEPSFFAYHYARLGRFAEHLGEVVILSGQAARSIAKRPLELRSTLHQLDSLGVKSMGIVAVTSLFIGMVMTIQFAFGLRRFGGVEYIPRVIILSSYSDDEFDLDADYSAEAEGGEGGGGPNGPAR